MQVERVLCAVVWCDVGVSYDKRLSCSAAQRSGVEWLVVWFVGEQQQDV